MGNNIKGYIENAQTMKYLVKLQKEYLGIESARSEVRITASNW